MWLAFLTDAWLTREQRKRGNLAAHITNCSLKKKKKKIIYISRLCFQEDKSCQDRDSEEKVKAKLAWTRRC